MRRAARERAALAGFVRKRVMRRSDMVHIISVMDATLG